MNIVIIGLSGAGKSTLFNKIVGKTMSITTEIDHSTTDYVTVNYQGDHCLIDTCGMDQLQGKSARQIKASDKIIYVTRGNLTEKDLVFVKKYKDKPMFLVVNRIKEAFNHEYFFEGAVYDDDLSSLKKWINWKNLEDHTRIALIGRANSGKSTLFNELLGYGRSIVADDIGTTRDCIQENYKNFILVDTPGYSNQNEPIDIVTAKLREKLMKSFQGFVLVINGNEPITKLDRLVYSKLDSIGSFSCIYINRSKEMNDDTIFFLKKIKNIPIFYKINQLRGYFNNVLKVLKIEKSTPQINKWLHSKQWRFFSGSGKPVKIKYMCQFSSSPIKIYYFANSTINAVGLRTLKNSFRSYFNIPGVQVMFYLKR